MALARLLLAAVGLCGLGLGGSLGQVTRYQPNWDSLDSRPLPKWFDRGKIGIFIHFGLYSVPGFKSEWFWCYWKCPDRVQQDVLDFIKNNYPPGFTYQDFARDFRLEFFNATEWVELFERAGARYAVLTSKHHEGFTLWPSKHSFSWNSVDVGPGRDIVGEFSAAVRSSANLHLGLYHSLFEWFNPLYKYDSDHNFTTRKYAATKGTAELYELVHEYRPDLIWSDGDAGPVDYWNSTGFLAWLYNDSPVKDKVVVNDRWGAGTACKHGGYLNCDDRYNPGTKQTRKWENAMTLDTQSWGHRRNANIQDFLTIKELLTVMAQTISNGGNLLVDVGPTKEGKIPVIMQERLLQMGDWLKINGEAIYDTKSWTSSNDSVTANVYYTAAKDDSSVFVILLEWPANGKVVLSSFVPRPGTDIRLVGSKAASPLKWQTAADGTAVIAMPDMATVQNLKHAWVLKAAKPKRASFV